VQAAATDKVFISLLYGRELVGPNKNMVGYQALRETSTDKLKELHRFLHFSYTLEVRMWISSVITKDVQNAFVPTELYTLKIIL
jgi:hypothetical protein